MWLQSTRSKRSGDGAQRGRERRGDAHPTDANSIWMRLWPEPVVEGTGFEPVYAKRSDLQSDGFNHSPTPPHFRVGNEAHRVSSGGLWLAVARVSTPFAHLVERNPAMDEKTEFIHRQSLAFLLQDTLIQSRRHASGGYSSMVEQQPSKLNTRVRFPLPAPNSPTARKY